MKLTIEEVKEHYNEYLSDSEYVSRKFDDYLSNLDESLKPKPKRAKGVFEIEWNENHITFNERWLKIHLDAYTIDCDFSIKKLPTKGVEQITESEMKALWDGMAEYWDLTYPISSYYFMHIAFADFVKEKFGDK